MTDGERDELARQMVPPFRCAEWQNPPPIEITMLPRPVVFREVETIRAAAGCV